KKHSTQSQYLLTPNPIQGWANRLHGRRGRGDALREICPRRPTPAPTAWAKSYARFGRAARFGHRSCPPYKSSSARRLAMSYRLDFSFLAEKWPEFLPGAWLTIQLTVLSIALGFAVGTVCAVVRVYGGSVLRRLVGLYVELIRNTPLLVQIF